MFLSFKSQEERRKYGGSCFVELQYCRLPSKTPLKNIVDVSSIENWKDDSLYVNDENGFYEAYSPFFTEGVYNNLQSGVVDVYGINYYDPALTERIVQHLLSEKPEDYSRLVAWLGKAKFYNGFYILGI